ncbi:MAG: hypothetical protein WCT22_01050 [Patescibacteria group bacterium]|jgi:hypothetical protein
MKTFLVAFAFFLLGLGAFWGYGKYQRLVDENNRLKTVEKTIPASAANDLPTPTLADIRGKITGSLGYPSEGIPELTVYAFDTLDQKKYFTVDTQVNQNSFTITNVDPGSYFVVAYPKKYDASGSYTKAVPCGLSVECTDHTMIDVIVNPGETASGVEVRDWYAPLDAFPKKP